MKRQQRNSQKKRRHFPWTRAIVALFISLLIAAATILAILTSGHAVAGYWLAIIPIIFSAAGLLIPLYQYLLPIPPDDKPANLPPIEVKISYPPPVAEPSTRNAIYLTKVVDPPHGEGRQTSTIWLDATGEITYIGDSITIRHWRGPLVSMESGAMLPDANYSFHFEYDSLATYALNPALVLSHEDRREVSFTLGLAPKGTFSSVGGHVEAVLHYHAPDGIQGKIQVKKPPREGVTLSRLLKIDIDIDGLITTPKGIQRGNDEDHDDQAKLIYQPIELPYYWFSGDEDSLGPAPNITLTPERLAINNAIEKEGVLNDIIRLLDEGDRLAFDLCSGLLCSECENALIKMGASSESARDALSALSVRHLLNPSDVLANFILDLSDNINLTGIEDVIVALAFQPKGKWVQALLELATRDHSQSLEVLYIVRDKLTDSDRQLIDAYSLKELDAFFPDETVLKYLLWRGYSITELDHKLQQIPSSASTDPALRSRCNIFRQRLRKEILGIDS